MATEPTPQKKPQQTAKKSPQVKDLEESPTSKSELAVTDIQLVRQLFANAMESARNLNEKNNSALTDEAVKLIAETSIRHALILKDKIEEYQHAAK